MKAVEVKMDITAPVVDSIEANPADWTNGDVVISGTVSDNLSGVNTVYYSIGAGETLVATLSGDKYEIIVKADEIKNYEGNVYVWCEDYTGNVGDNVFTEIAIDTENPTLLREELGDVLLQIVFHAGIEEDEGRFDIDDVANDICVKLIHRHPHVFGDVSVENTAADSDKSIENGKSKD